MTDREALREIYIGARWLISDPKRWTKGAFARTRGGGPCQPESESASCWCAAGAIYAASPNFDVSITPLRVAIGGMVTDWNDSSTHAQVLGGFDRAIESLS